MESKWKKKKKKIFSFTELANDISGNFMSLKELPVSQIMLTMTNMLESH